MSLAEVRHLGRLELRSREVVQALGAAVDARLDRLARILAGLPQGSGSHAVLQVGLHASFPLVHLSQVPRGAYADPDGLPGFVAPLPHQGALLLGVPAGRESGGVRGVEVPLSRLEADLVPMVALSPDPRAWSLHLALAGAQYPAYAFRTDDEMLERALGGHAGVLRTLRGSVAYGASHWGVAMALRIDRRAALAGKLEGLALVPPPTRLPVIDDARTATHAPETTMVFRTAPVARPGSPLGPIAAAVAILLGLGGLGALLFRRLAARLGRKPSLAESRQTPGGRRLWSEHAGEPVGPDDLPVRRIRQELERAAASISEVQQRLGRHQQRWRAVGELVASVPPPDRLASALEAVRGKERGDLIARIEPRLGAIASHGAELAFLALDLALQPTGSSPDLARRLKELAQALQAEVETLRGMLGEQNGEACQLPEEARNALEVLERARRLLAESRTDRFPELGSSLAEIALSLGAVDGELADRPIGPQAVPGQA